MSIELHIERLVLDEALLGGERASDVGAALERELLRLMAQPGASDALRTLGTVLALPAVQLPPAAACAGGLGPRIAQAVRRGLDRGFETSGGTHG
ncbi:MAG: hypothetical protein ACTS5I_03000 [Rhodanobacter sp.]